MPWNETVDTRETIMVPKTTNFSIVDYTGTHLGTLQEHIFDNTTCTGTFTLAVYSTINAIRFRIWKEAQLYFCFYSIPEQRSDIGPAELLHFAHACR